MTDAIIMATYQNWKTVPSRGVLQLIFEVPLERQGEVLERLGAPPIKDAEWYSIAKLDPETAGKQGNDEQAADKPTDEEDILSEEGKRARAEALSQARPKPDKTPGERAVACAAICCEEPAFQEWMDLQYGGFDKMGLDPAEWTAITVRWICSVESRAELAHDPDALARWQTLYSEYRQSQEAPMVGEKR